MDKVEGLIVNRAEAVAHCDGQTISALFSAVRCILLCVLLTTGTDGELSLVEYFQIGVTPLRIGDTDKGRKYQTINYT